MKMKTTENAYVPLFRAILPPEQVRVFLAFLETSRVMVVRCAWCGNAAETLRKRSGSAAGASQVMRNYCERSAKQHQSPRCVGVHSLVTINWGPGRASARAPH